MVWKHRDKGVAARLDRRRGAACQTVALALGLLGLAAAEAEAQTYQNTQQEPGYQRQYSPQQLQCMRLENQLANNWLRDKSPQGDQRKQIEAEIRKYDRIYQKSEAAAERSDCYRSGFIFGRSLVRTPRCIRLHNRIQNARRQLTTLHEQREAARSGNTASGRQQRQDDLIEALARNGCGEQYRREANRRRGFFGWFSNDDDQYDRRRNLETSKIVPYATYRTLCVRQCDGYYFPVSFSTLPSRFTQDQQKCVSQCAAPAELFVYRNPGEEPQQMVSVDGKAYSSLPNAFRYRREFIKGCSCKVAEYSPEEIEAHETKKASEKKSGAAPKAGSSSKVAKGDAEASKQQ